MTYNDFIKERLNILHKKQSKKPRPWTQDQILNTYHFCNIDRINDKGTIKLLEVIKDKDFELQLLIIFIYRISSSGNIILNVMRNLSEEEILLYIDKNIDIKYKNGYVSYQFNSYTSGVTIKNYLQNYIFTNLNSIKNKILSYNKETLLKATFDILKIINFKRNLTFIIHQIVADISYIKPDNINTNSICYIGSGAEAALKKLNKTIEELKEDTNLNYLQLEHSLCEYNKYLLWKNNEKSTERLLYTPTKHIQLF